MSHSLRLPYPGYLWTVVRKSALMWLLVRLMVFVFLWLVARVGIAEAAGAPTLGIPAVLVWLDRRRAREQLLHANLGASELWFWAASLLTVCVLDGAAHLLLASLGIGSGP